MKSLIGLALALLAEVAAAQLSAPGCAHPALAIDNIWSCAAPVTSTYAGYGACGWTVTPGPCLSNTCPWTYIFSCPYAGSYACPSGKCCDVEYWACQSSPPLLPRCTNGQCAGANGSYTLQIIIKNVTDCPPNP